MLNGRDFRIRLTRDEERRLWERMRDGDQAARDRLLESQMPWIMRLARKIRTVRSEFDDLVSAGVEAMLEQCLPKFDPSLGRLSTYSTRSVWWAMKNFDASNTLISRAQNRSERYGAQWDAASHPAVELTEFAKVTRDADHADREQLDRLRRAIDRLPPRERTIIRHRLAGETLKEVGDRIGVTRERVRQIELRAKNRLAADLAPSEISDSSATPLV